LEPATRKVVERGGGRRGHNITTPPLSQQLS
jgi:hypothetical protein